MPADGRTYKMIEKVPVMFFIHEAAAVMNPCKTIKMVTMSVVEPWTEVVMILKGSILLSRSTDLHATSYNSLKGTTRARHSIFVVRSKSLKKTCYYLS